MLRVIRLRYWTWRVARARKSRSLMAAWLAMSLVRRDQPEILRARKAYDRASWDYKVACAKQRYAL